MLVLVAKEVWLFMPDVEPIGTGPDAVETTATRRLLPTLPSALAALLVAIPSLLHFFSAYRSVKTGLHEIVPTVFSSGETGLTGWLTIYRHLFFKPASTVALIRIYALWILVLLVLSIYLALRSGARLPSGVGSFIAYGLSALVMLAMATPAVWYVLGSWGPAAAEFAPPVILTLVALLMLRSGWSET